MSMTLIPRNWKLYNCSTYLERGVCPWLVIRPMVVVSLPYFTIEFSPCQGLQSWVYSIKWRELSTPPIGIVWGLFVRRFNIRIQSVVLSFMRELILNADLNSTNSILMSVLFSMCVKTQRRAVETASSVNLFWMQTREGPGRRGCCLWFAGEPVFQSTSSKWGFCHRAVVV